MIPAVLGIRGSLALPVSFLLVTAIDPALFAQVITWTSGFQNYLPPVFLILLALWLIQKYPAEPERRGTRALICLAMVVIGVAAQLYVEHSSLINVALAMVITAKAWKDPHRHGLLPALLLLAATILGLALMFWIPIQFFTSANDHTTGYRSLHLGSIATLVYSCARNALRLTNHYFGMCGLPLCTGAAITVHLTRHRRSQKSNSILYAFSVIPGTFILVCTLLSYEGWYGEPAILFHAIAMLAVLSALAVWVIALIRMEDTLFRNRVLVLLGFAVFALLPLLVVTPVHIRVAYHSQSFVIMAFMLCLFRWAEEWKPQWISRIQKGLLTAAAAVVLSMGLMFFSIHSMNQARDTYILQQIENGVQQVDTFRIPYDYVHEYTDTCMGNYYYRDERMDVEFNIIPYDFWMNDILDTVK